MNNELRCRRRRGSVASLGSPDAEEDYPTATRTPNCWKTLLLWSKGELRDESPKGKADEPSLTWLASASQTVWDKDVRALEEIDRQLREIAHHTGLTLVIARPGP